jgi:Flp pilus assembly protein TadD
MTNRTFSLLLASAAVFGTSMVGCSGARLERRPLAVGEQAQAPATRVERLLASKDYARALLIAEDLVAARNEDDNARALLGRAYLANGRYASARGAFNDALALGNRDPRTIVSLALCETGLGNPEAARALLAAHVQDLPAGDYGLAMAMAGDPQEGVRALVQAVRAPDATAKMRQNLAYALAMGGAWAQARLVAGQDLPARDAEHRMGEWAQSFLAGKETDRVVAMIGIAPRADDPGLPVALALHRTTDETVVLASAEEATGQPAEHPSETATEALAVNDPGAPLAASSADLPAPARLEAPRRPAEPVRARAVMPLPSVFALPTRTMEQAKPAELGPFKAALQAVLGAPETVTSRAPKAGRMNWTASFAPPAADADASDWVIQLGAFDSAAIARDNWRRVTARRAELARFQTVNSTVALGGRTFHRLAIRGFEGRTVAAATCQALKSFGQACFVRLDDSGATRLARVDAQKALRQAAVKPKAENLELAAR